MATLDEGTATYSERPASVSDRRSYSIVKRGFDLVISFLALLVAVPLGATLAVAIKLDSPGPVFFRQERVGQHARTFRLVKFRTMCWPPEPELHQDHVLSIALSASDKRARLRLDGDHRVTRVGRFLRKWSLDELPNLWSVFKGEMSLVGPRPLVPYEIQVLDDAALERLSVKPGVTGLAQINGRLDASVDLRSDHDLEYVRKCCLRTDLAILIRTPWALIRQRG